MSSKVADSFSDSQVPKLDHVVFASRKESVECFVVGKTAFIELNGMRVLEMAVINNLNGLVHIRVVNHDLLV
jgi:hypothetical protein